MGSIVWIRMMSAWGICFWHEDDCARRKEIRFVIVVGERVSAAKPNDISPGRTCQHPIPRTTDRYFNHRFNYRRVPPAKFTTGYFEKKDFRLL